jgi:hypothetical protein
MFTKIFLDRTHKTFWPNKNFLKFTFCLLLKKFLDFALSLSNFQICFGLLTPHTLLLKNGQIEMCTNQLQILERLSTIDKSLLITSLDILQLYQLQIRNIIFGLHN